jgi:hypothetical protein
MRRLASVVVALALSCAFCGLAIPRASASPISYQFTVTASTGPLTGVTSVGTFTFDSSIVPVGGGLVDIAGLLSQLSFTWGGMTFSAATANTGELQFNSSGIVVGALFGTSCGPSGFGCGVTAGTHDWEFFLNPAPGNRGFDYAIPADPLNTFFQLGGVTLTGPLPVPTPGTLPLLSAALGALGLIAWGLRPR